MKKLLILALVTLLLLTALTSCRLPQSNDYFGDAMEENPDIKVPESEVMQPDPEDIPKYEINDTLTKYEAEMTFDIPATDDHEAGQLLVKYKVYDFAAEERNVAIISVENHSTQSLTISFDGKCTNTQSGEEKIVTRGFEGFAAGWQNYFIFDPEMAFDEFDYEIEFEMFEGKTYGQNIQNLHWSGLRLNNAAQSPWEQGCVRVFGLFFYDYVGGEADDGFSGGFVLFNEQDKVVFCEPDATHFQKVYIPDPNSYPPDWAHAFIMPHLGKDEGFMWNDLEPKRNNLPAEESNYVPTEDMFKVTYGIFSFKATYDNREEAPPSPAYPPISDIW